MSTVQLAKKRTRILDSQLRHLPGGMNELNSRDVLVLHENQSTSDVVDQQGNRMAPFWRKIFDFKIEEIDDRIPEEVYLTSSRSSNHRLT